MSPLQFLNGYIHQLPKVNTNTHKVYIGYHGYLDEDMSGILTLSASLHLQEHIFLLFQPCT